MAIRELTRFSSSDAAALACAQHPLIGFGRDYPPAELDEAGMICARICRSAGSNTHPPRSDGEKGEARTAAAAAGSLCPEYYLPESNGFP
jgi:hypothetical protein